VQLVADATAISFGNTDNVYFRLEAQPYSCLHTTNFVSVSDVVTKQIVVFVLGERKRSCICDLSYGKLKSFICLHCIGNSVSPCKSSDSYLSCEVKFNMCARKSGVHENCWLNCMGQSVLVEW